MTKDIVYGNCSQSWELLRKFRLFYAFETIQNNAKCTWEENEVDDVNIEIIAISKMYSVSVCFVSYDQTTQSPTVIFGQVMNERNVFCLVIS
jgi:hypothetical protein